MELRGASSRIVEGGTGEAHCFAAPKEQRLGAGALALGGRAYIPFWNSSRIVDDYLASFLEFFV
eukprot:1009535-Prymnesium_polylepis.1